MTTFERIDQLEDKVKVLTSALRALIKDIRMSQPELERDCDGEIVDCSIDYDFPLLHKLEESLKD